MQNEFERGYSAALHDVLNFIREIHPGEPSAIGMIQVFIAKKHMEEK